MDYKYVFESSLWYLLSLCQPVSNELGTSGVRKTLLEELAFLSLMTSWSSDIIRFSKSPSTANLTVLVLLLRLVLDPERLWDRSLVVDSRILISTASTSFSAFSAAASAAAARLAALSSNFFRLVDFLRMLCRIFLRMDFPLFLKNCWNTNIRIEVSLFTI